MGSEEAIASPPTFFKKGSISLSLVMGCSATFPFRMLLPLLVYPTQPDVFFFSGFFSAAKLLKHNGFLSGLETENTKSPMCDLSPSANVMEWDKPTQARVSRKECIVCIPKLSGSLNHLAFYLILFKLFSETSIFSEKGREYYGLLSTPQCDKSFHLHIERDLTWVSLCSQSLIYSTIHIA